MSWVAPYSGGTPDDYLVTWAIYDPDLQAADLNWFEEDVTSTSYLITGLENQLEYVIFVYARNAGGWSELEGAVVSPQAPPTTTAAVELSPSATQYKQIVAGALPPLSDLGVSFSVMDPPSDGSTFPYTKCGDRFEDYDESNSVSFTTDQDPPFNVNYYFTVAAYGSISAASSQAESVQSDAEDCTVSPQGWTIRVYSAPDVSVDERYEWVTWQAYLYTTNEYENSDYYSSSVVVTIQMNEYLINLNFNSTTFVGYPIIDAEYEIASIWANWMQLNLSESVLEVIG